MQYEIIDFHTHPFDDAATNICRYQENCGMTPENAVSYLNEMGISRICGSVICRNQDGINTYASPWEMIVDGNDRALSLRERYSDFYIPGFHVHPDFLPESRAEIERMHRQDVRLIGELVPYMHGWSDYSCDAFGELLDMAAEYGMVVNIHTMDHDQMDVMVQKHPRTVIVAAHPGEQESFRRHLCRMEMSGNYYLDLSGTGLFRHGMLRHGIDLFGAERFLFGTDYPICTPSMYVGGVALDSLLTEEEKRMVFAGNAKRLLHLD